MKREDLYKYLEFDGFKDEFKIIRDMNLGCKIKLGSWLRVLINIVTLGTGKYIATWIAVDLFNFESCGCCEREQWLNRLTCKTFNGDCDKIKLW